MATVDIPVSVTSIAQLAFYGCSSLASVTIPSSVTSIEEQAFCGCTSLASVATPTSVTSIGADAFNGCSSLASVEILASRTSLGSISVYDADEAELYGAFTSCASLAVLMVQPTDTNDSDNCATAASTSDLVKAFNKQHQFPAVTQIWAPDHIVAQLTGRFNDFKRFADLPRALRAAPDATTWAGVQRWLWWIPPSSFARGDGSGGDDARVVCQPRVATIWTTMLSAYKSSEVLDLLPDLEPELWELIFTFIKHVDTPSHR